MSEKTKPLAARTDSFRNVPGPNSAENPIATNADIVKAETAAEVADSAAKLDDGVAKLNINENEAILAPVDKHDAPVDEKPKFAAPTTPLTKLFAELPAITTEAGHSEMWGVQLSDESDVPSSIVLEKFLRANTKDVEKAKAQLIQALKWRKSIDPAKLLADVRFDPAKFGGVGYVTTYAEGKEIVSWNIYGAVKDKKATFGNVEEFINWRSALMELSVQKLDLASATEKIPADGVDQYRMVQVHDYLSVSFFKMDPAVKAASKEVIATFSMAYPELLKEKFFVNVPVLMGWVSAAMKLFLSAETIKKFHPLTYGSALAGELSFGKELPTPYGGNGKPGL
ncbi:CRAL-TRIO domain-containing protein [Calycina marina]|uniref:Phosphatidylinositol transfer protein SFH5 n=1 Tax=Calycina marina TaxID=1763456 RepID=A0A9P7Z2P2_9HELO|nr:CRAL-TRIO domain-containing protein [Calycina marina]